MSAAASVSRGPAAVSASSGLLARAFTGDPGLRFVLPGSGDPERLDPLQAHLESIAQRIGAAEHLLALAGLTMPSSLLAPRLASRRSVFSGVSSHMRQAARRSAEVLHNTRRAAFDQLARNLVTRVDRRRVLQGVGGAVALGLGSCLWPAAAQEGTPEGGDPLAQWAPGQTATINGAALYYEVQGDPAGQPVLLLHGGLGNIEDFANLAPVLVGAGYRVVALDNRGRGRSTWGDLPITYEQMAADAVALLDYLGIAKTDVVGYSDGAITSLNLAIHHPERLNRVGAYAANFTPEGAQFAPSEQTPPFERWIAAYRRLSPEPARFEELNEALNALYTVAPNYSEAELQSITVPVLILDGEADEFVKPDQPVRMAELIPGATLVIMPGTGHFAIFAKPAVFDQIVLDYLAGKAVSTPGTSPAGTPTP